MADNVSITAGSGVTIAADDIGGVQYQRVKISQGADGAATDVSSAAPLQVSLANHAANATAVKVDGSAATQPVSAASLPLPSGASTAAKQPALGTAGTASADVITVQGIASMTALKVDGSAVTQPVSGSLTTVSTVTNLSQLGGAAVPIGAGLETTAIRVTLPTDGTGKVGLNAGTNAIGKLAANSGVDIGDVDITSIAAGDNNIGNVDIVTVPTDPFGANADAASATGSISAKLKFIASTGIPVTGTVTVGSHAVTNAGTFAVQATSVGTVADDATTPGAPVMVGGKAVETDGTDPTSVSAEDDVAIFRTDRNRRLLVNDFHPNLWSANEDHTTAQTNNALKAAPGAGLSLYITDLVISNGATAGTVQFVEDTAGTPVNKTSKLYLAINGGAVMNFRTPIRITANKDFGFTSVTVTTHTLTVNGFIAP